MISSSDFVRVEGNTSHKGSRLQVAGKPSALDIKIQKNLAKIKAVTITLNQTSYKVNKNSAKKWLDSHFPDVRNEDAHYFPELLQNALNQLYDKKGNYDPLKAFNYAISSNFHDKAPLIHDAFVKALINYGKNPTRSLETFFLKELESNSKITPFDREEAKKIFSQYYMTYEEFENKVVTYSSKIPISIGQKTYELVVNCVKRTYLKNLTSSPFVPSTFSDFHHNFIKNIDLLLDAKAISGKDAIAAKELFQKIFHAKSSL